jgi:hypothetical protein
VLFHVVYDEDVSLFIGIGFILKYKFPGAAGAQRDLVIVVPVKIHIGLVNGIFHTVKLEPRGQIIPPEEQAHGNLLVRTGLITPLAAPAWMQALDTSIFAQISVRVKGKLRVGIGGILME